MQDVSMFRDWDCWDYLRDQSPNFGPPVSTSKERALGMIVLEIPYLLIVDLRWKHCYRSPHPKYAFAILFTGLSSPPSYLEALGVPTL